MFCVSISYQLGQMIVKKSLMLINLFEVHFPPCSHSMMLDRTFSMVKKGTQSRMKKMSPVVEACEACS